MEKSDQDLSPTRNLLHFPISPAKMDSLQKQSHSVLDSQSLREDQRGEDLELRLGVKSHSVLDSQSLREDQGGEDLELRLGVKSQEPPRCSPVKSLQASVSKQYVTSPQKPLPHQFDHQLQKNQLGKCRVSKQDPVTPDKQRRCTCKSSKCLMLYCECFASGSYCNGCNCLDCHNNLENEAIRQKAITVILVRSPNAFKPKIADSPKGDLTPRKHIKGCHCRRSGCIQKYCECYQANILCSENCKCQDCLNFEGSEERNVLLHAAQVSETYIQQTTNAPVKRAIDMTGYMNSPESKKRKSKDASHSVAARVYTGANIKTNTNPSQEEPGDEEPKP